MIWLRNDKSHDPCYNLAFEEFAFRNIGIDEPVVIIWQNEPTIVVGRWQNTIEEIDREYVEKNGIHVVRRITGGGAVYHDLGNVNYTYISPKSNNEFKFADFVKPVIKALGKMGIEAELSGRNDITINGAKVSGNAEHSSQNKLLHHGCILYSADLSVVANCLRVKPDKFQSKAIKSVRSRVANISDFLDDPPSIEEFKKLILDTLTEGGAEEYALSAEELQSIRELADTKYRTWEWTYGQSPKCNTVKRKRFDMGSVELKMQIENGIIAECSVFGDFFTNGNPERIAKAITGVRLEKADIMAALEKVNVPMHIPGVSAEDIAELATY